MQSPRNEPDWETKQGDTGKVIDAGKINISKLVVIVDNRQGGKQDEQGNDILLLYRKLIGHVEALSLVYEQQISGESGYFMGEDGTNRNFCFANGKNSSTNRG